MKTFSKKHRVIIILIIILGFSIPFYANVELFQGNKISNPESINELTLKKAGYWEIGPIKIDDDDPTKNWSVTASTYDWCSGSGLLSDPYIIENVTIDGQNTYNCIHIDNSDVYFMIRNCVVYNAHSRGILLEDVDNGIIYNNTSTQNYNGIYIRSANFINISNNYVIGNSHNGIEIGSFCGSCIVSDNVIINNNHHGIVLRQENLFCNITNNTVIGHTNSGIQIQGGSNYNNILFNTVKENPGNGISIYQSHHNNFSLNTLYNNKQLGIILKEDSSNNIVSQNSLNGCGIGFGAENTLSKMSSNSIDDTNTVNGKPIAYYKNEIGLQPDDFTNSGQLILLNCDNSLISDLNFSHGGGISLYFCENNEILRNTVNSNYRAISLLRSDKNTIMQNIADNNTSGIYLWDSENNNITKNYANSNEYGINLESCINTTISENHVCDNKYGIYEFWYGNTNTISGNTANNNEYGIYLFDSEKNIVSENFANNNEYGIFLEYSNNNTISGNTINYNYYGIFLRASSYNIISGNNLVGNIVCINESYCESNSFINNNCGNEQAIPGYNLFFLLGTAAIALVIIEKRLEISKKST